MTSQFNPDRVNVYGFGTEKGRTYKTDEELLKELEAKQLREKESKEKQLKDKGIRGETAQRKAERSGETAESSTGPPEKTGDVEQKKPGTLSERRTRITAVKAGYNGS